ncbi:MAG: nucleotide exchange factor GrpE, partial [Verrucomicrobia bacterium]
VYFAATLKMMSTKENLSKETNRSDATPPGEAEHAAEAATHAEKPEAEQATKETTARAEVPLTPQQIEELKVRAAKADEHWDRLLRATADLENFKKRAARERQEATRFANASLLEKLIPALDNFDMALAAASNTEGNSLESLKTGLTMVYNQLKAVLTEAGLEEIDASGRPFDPNLHEAVSQQETADVPEGQVLRQLRKGYKLRDRLIRPASVVVAKKPAV